MSPDPEIRRPENRPPPRDLSQDREVRCGTETYDAARPLPEATTPFDPAGAVRSGAQGARGVTDEQSFRLRDTPEDRAAFEWIRTRFPDAPEPPYADIGFVDHYWRGFVARIIRRLPEIEWEALHARARSAADRRLLDPAVAPRVLSLLEAARINA